jgi:hypothetical protein
MEWLTAPISMVHEQLSNKVFNYATEKISQLWYIATVKYLAQYKS